MLKHVGTYQNKKIVLLYREVPGEDHMCLVTYSDALPGMLHDEVMRVLESASGQQAQSLSDALFRHIMPDGSNCLESLHRNNLIKKVPTNAVTVTPNSKSKVRLDELNKLLNDMDKGRSAEKEFSEKIKETSKSSSGTENSAAPSADAVLSDRDLAQERVRQALAMKADAERLLREAESLLAEATALDPGVKHEPTKKKTKVKAS